MASQQPRKGMYSSKVGLMWPQSPRGVASLMDLNSEPDLTMSDDTLIVGWETDPAVIREYVPEPLEVDGSGRMFLMSQHRWGYTSRNAKEFISAERLNQTESWFLIPCTYQGKKFRFKSFSFGNRDWLAQSGRMIGLNHKWADVQMTTFHPFALEYSKPHAGARVCVTVENIGTVLRAYGDLERIVPREELPWAMGGMPDYHGSIGHRYVYDPCARKPALNDLVVGFGDNMELSPIWYGDGWIKFYDAENEEVQQFEPRRMLGAWWFYVRFNHSINPPYVLHEYGDVSPYASRPRIKQLLGQ
jgi:hypothetical protein